MNRENNKTQHLFMEADRGVTVEKDGQRRCMGCMEIYSSEFDLCPECGYPINADVENALHMYPGTSLNEKYVVGKVLGYGGFGVTYLAWDTILQIKVAIKEYLPSELSTRSAGQTRVTVFSGEKSKQFSDGKEKFIDEAKRLAIFRNEPGIVKIYDTFEENGTAYIVMELLEGETLEKRLAREGKIPEKEAIEMIMPVIESLNKVHDEGIVHRDIAPDNLFLTNDGNVKLIDFGAARYATAINDKSLTVIVKQRYSPEEQYRSTGEQGPHTDVYSLGAVLYRMVTGELPPDAMERRAYYEKKGKDSLIPIDKLTNGVSKNTSNAIYNALNMRIQDRTPDMITFAGELLSEEPVKIKKNSLKKVDLLTWPLWAKIGIPVAILIVILLCVLFATGIIGPRSGLETDFNIPEGRTLVPDVVSLELHEARQKIEENDLQWRIKDTEVSETIKSGFVLAHTPDAGNISPVGTYIDITMSAGLGAVYIENYIGCDYSEVKLVLEEKGFKVTVQEQNNQEYGAGIVFDQSIKDVSVESGTEIVLSVSKGKEYDTSLAVTVPNVIGKTYEQAKSVLDEQHLVIERHIEYVYDMTKETGAIVSQIPESGMTANHGDRVEVTINLGKRTTYVPNVVNSSETRARDALEKAGLVVNVEYGQNRNYAVGTVYAQSTEADNIVPYGSVITLTVCEGYSNVVPNVVNMELKKAQTTLKNSGFASDVKEYQVNSSVEKGCVISQSIAANTKTDCDTIVYLVISSGSDEKSENLETVASGDILGQGVCGINLKWVLYKNGELVISGSGDMFDNPEWTVLAVNIKDVVFNGKITSIGRSAFSSCVNLAKIVIPATVNAIGDNAFQSCTSLKNIVISDGVSSIGENAFASCKSLTSVTIPDSVKNIGDYAFENCSSLREIEVPEKVESIGENTFENCSELSQVKIADTVQSIEKYVSENVTDSSETSTTKVQMPTKVEKTTKVSTSIKDVTIPAEITEDVVEHILETGTYQNGTAVSDEVMQEVVEYALQNSSNLKDVKISKEVMEEIAKYALENGDSLKNIEISEEMMQEIVEFAIGSGNTLNDIEISDSMMKEIITFISQNSSSFADLKISDSMMKEIIKFMSENDGSLDNLNISTSLMKEIAEYVYSNASVLKELKISDSFIKEILNFISSNSSMFEDITISDKSKKELAGYISENISGLSDVTIPQEIIDYGIESLLGARQ